MSEWKRALLVAADALDIASDYDLDDVQVEPPQEWNLDARNEDVADGWCSTSALAAKLREIAAAPSPEWPGAYQLVQSQAEDDGLWFEAETAAEAYLQQELRKLHAAVEVAAPSPEWVKVSERLPTREDADNVGNVWVCLCGVVDVDTWLDAVEWVYWMPKPRVQPPEPPEGE